MMLLAQLFSGRSRRDVAARARGGCFVLALIFCGSGTALTVRAEEVVTKEYEVKAAFLYNFTKFIEWPEGAFPTQGSPLIIGILGHDPFNGELERVVKDRKLKGRAIEVRHVGTAEDLNSIQLLFVPANEDKRWSMLGAVVKNYPILTVSESPLSDAPRTMIRFFVESDKVRFAIDDAVAAQAKLTISAQLLYLASSVHRR